MASSKCYEDRLKAFAVELYKINAVKFGEYKTKVGLMTPVYCDLRVIVSYPKLMGVLADLIIESMPHMKDFDIVCGVPYTALPIATTISYKVDLPMVMRRKEAKDYGTKKLIEGFYKDNDTCLIIEDVVTSGSSILETVKDLTAANIQTTEAVVLLNREQGGEKLLKDNGIKMHALLTMTQLMKFLKEADCVTDETCQKVADYLKASQVDASVLNKTKLDRLKMPYEERISHSSNAIAKRLFKIMSEKKTNLCIAADLTDAAEILNLAEAVGPHVCLFKTHIDIVEGFSEVFVKNLKSIAEKHNFVLFEDRKFADIGKTCQLQYSKGVYGVSSWAPLVTAHSLTGSGVLEALEQAEGLAERGVFVLAECSAKGSLIDDKYVKATVAMGVEKKSLVTGFVCQSKLFVEQPGFVQLTPGVQLGSSGDGLGQQYNTPEAVMLERGADVAVVGRGITKASNPAAAAVEYKKLLWDSYLKRISN
ncbi:PREDICTED: uridine 5'-monophosphate synthase [Nicrophorus vespilloides]|uniref:Uridine 5'-monophosphate synthase n=1 Tax=Nicrophorus vespilloides TaxID=110193 RepID=A0ABM1MCF4_NICVS|nr:PREDICTED: uridine 5'-monophosphate synthase [Nicrophorus vespilloides]